MSSLRDKLLARTPQDLSPIDQAEVQVEIRPLIEAMNHHTQRIEKMIESRQRFIADASHQLRTPLSEMRTQVEYTLRQDDPKATRETLGDVRLWIDNQTRLISQLLMTERADPDVLQQHPTTALDLAALARDVALEFVSTARRKTIDLSFEGPHEAVSIQGNALLLHEMVANLIDNAIRYTPPYGSITVRVLLTGAASGGHAVLEVADNGPGIAPAEQARVFERFYRGANAGANTFGSGLGLSIVRDICASHQAAITLGSPSGGGSGLCARVAFGAPQVS